MNQRFFGITYGFEENMPHHLVAEATQKMQELQEHARDEFEKWLDEKGLENAMGMVIFDKHINRWILEFKDCNEIEMKLEPGDVFRATNRFGDVYTYTYIGWAKSWEPGFDWEIQEKTSGRFLHIEPEWLHQRRIEILKEEEACEP